MSVVDAMRFMVAQQFGRFNLAHESEIQIKAGRRQYSADLYLNAGESKGTIVIVHGMSVYGNQDERIKNLGRALATVGYRVVAPLLPSIKALEIDPSQADEVAGILLAISGDSDLTRGGRLGVLAPSFSAAMSLKAVGRPDLHSIVSSLMVIGGFADLPSTLEFLMGKQDADEYGRLVIMWNFLHLHLGRRKRKLIDAFKVAATDNGKRLPPEACELPAYLETLSKKDREHFQKLRQDPEYRIYIWHKTMQTRALKKKCDQMDVLQMAVDVRTPITLLHGRDDDVIHADQSELLYDALVKQGTPAHLCITGLISHGDSGSIVKMLPEAVGLARAFAYFFENI